MIVCIVLSLVLLDCELMILLINILMDGMISV